MSEFFATNAPDPPHWTLNTCFAAFHTFSVCFRPFDYYTNLGAKQVKLVQLVQKFVPQRRVRILRNKCTRSTPLDHKLLLCTIWVHLGPLSCLTKLGAKRSELVQKFVPRCCVESFRNERTRSTPLDPKLLFWCVSYILGVFRTI